MYPCWDDLDISCLLGLFTPSTLVMFLVEHPQTGSLTYVWIYAVLVASIRGIPLAIKSLA